MTMNKECFQKKELSTTCCLTTKYTLKKHKETFNYVKMTEFRY